MKKIKAIFIDIDGTLTNDQGIIPENVKNVIGKLTAQGIKVIVTSGRNYNYTKKIQIYYNKKHISFNEICLKFIEQLFFVFWV